jgi:nucleotide-binding universal stress UspA family protein
MNPKVIVSYDDTAADRDALALGHALGEAGAEVALAYVRHDQRSPRHREELHEHEAEDLLARGALQYGDPAPETHVVSDASTADGLRALIQHEGADVIVFGSEYRTPKGNLQPGTSAQRMLEGGPVAVAIAPAGIHDGIGLSVKTVGAIGEVGDRSPLETAASLADKLGAQVVEKADSGVDLLVVGSQQLAAAGRVSMTAAAQYVVETSRCPVLVLPRGKTVRF